jgi:hypothetical protein
MLVPSIASKTFCTPIKGHVRWKKRLLAFTVSILSEPPIISSRQPTLMLSSILRPHGVAVDIDGQTPFSFLPKYKGELVVRNLHCKYSHDGNVLTLATIFGDFWRAPEVRT